MRDATALVIAGIALFQAGIRLTPSTGFAAWYLGIAAALIR